jgi:hypothetical protein
LRDVVAVAAGESHSVALRSDGSVVEWGLDHGGRTTVVPTLSSVVGVAAGYDHSLAVKADGTVVAWGATNYGQTKVPTGLTAVSAVAAGWAHSMALRSDGTVVAWGRNDVGQATVPAGLTGVVAIEADGAQSLALLRDGSIVAWGSDASETLVASSRNTPWVAALLGSEHVIAALDARSPFISSQPTSQTASQGDSTAFAVNVEGQPDRSYQWRRNGTIIPGATGSTLTLSSVSAADAGTYTVVVTNSAGAVTSTGAVLTVSAARASRISNVSIRTTLNPRQLLIVGLTMTGGAKDVLMRAVGPGLGAFGVSNAMVDPDLSLYEGDSRVATNDNWGGGASLATAAASVGAFPLVASSKDAALLRSFSGGRTLHVQGADGGNVIVEAYDAGSGDSPRLSNVSARNFAGSGGDTLIAGFSITGNTAKRVLIRAVGPTLGLFGVAGAIADPKLEVYAGSNRVAENDNWSASLASAFSSVGAFGLTAGSRDSALEISLNPGGYTVHVTPASGSGGEVLIEIYELP